MQLTVLQALDYRNPSQTDRKQLTASHYAVLPLRQPGNRLVLAASGRFDIDSATNCPLACHAANAEAAGRIGGAQFVPIPSTGARKRPQPAVAASGFDPFK